MAKQKPKDKPEVIPAKTEGSSLVIDISDPVGMYITRETNMSLPAKITKDTPNAVKIVKSYILRSNGCNQVANAETADKFLKKNNLITKESK